MNLRVTASAALIALGATMAQAQSVPEGYPTDYAQMIEASRSEQGVLVYSNFPASIWKPLITAFNEVYPWIKVETADFDAEMWEKHKLESKQNVRTADLITTVAPEHWRAFVEDGYLDAYQSPELPNLPDWSVPLDGLYTLSTVPMPITWNKALVNPAPESLADIVQMATDDPDKWNGKITIYDSEVNPYGMAIIRNWLNHRNNDWSMFEAIGPMTRPERGGGAMREKVSTGEYLVSIFPAGVSVSAFESPGVKAVMDYGWAKDGTPVSLQSMGVTKAASSPNSARILLDYILSKPGQVAFSKGGFTPYREDITTDEAAFYTLSEIRDIVGEQNLYIMSYAPEDLAGTDELVAQWKKVFRGK